ncbi:MAG: histidinol-phosphatase [Lentisphaeria bacterium]|nr:histidinol-phosphatase [Lentisphaeria bacterium]
MIRANWHTHTYRCKHATGDVEDYCREAVLRGLDVLGFSDHAPLPDGRWKNVRMEMTDLAGYCAAVVEARACFPGLDIRSGLECEYVPEFATFYQEVFLGEQGLEYLVGGAHWYPFEGGWAPLYGVPMDGPRLRAYTEYLIRSMTCGLFAFIAHPDLFGNAYPVWDHEAQACSRAMLCAAADLGLPLEINAYGLRKPMLETPDGPRHRYPWLPFWELAAECGASAIISSDAHEPEDVTADMAAAEDIARRFGLTVITDPLAQPARTH